MVLSEPVKFPMRLALMKYLCKIFHEIDIKDFGWTAPVGQFRLVQDRFDMELEIR